MESGIAVIDYEHKTLIEQLAELTNEPNPYRVGEMLEFLKDYVVKHFAHEQLMHKKTGYPKAAEHKAAHTEFVRTYVDLEREYLDKGASQETLARLVSVVGDWIRDHIKGQDMEFVAHYREFGDSSDF